MRWDNTKEVRLFFHSLLQHFSAITDHLLSGAINFCYSAHSLRKKPGCSRCNYDIDWYQSDISFIGTSWSVSASSLSWKILKSICNRSSLNFERIY